MDNESMYLLTRSTPTEVRIEKRGESSTYELSLPAPFAEPVTECFELEERMAKDGLPFGEIVLNIRKWLRAWAEEVDKIAISYTGGKYSVGILLAELTEEHTGRVCAAVRDLAKGFGGLRPITYVLGPNQKESSLLSESECYIVKAF